ncbi:phospholipase D-like domain-containing protein [Natronorubrum thiooxidans]|uniref:Uncharacterized protein n=1 Tax=Natronorubrum thiooxidans TaxID=308853 RepID=A0A1N7E2G7_9EURY|nr:hypothetical protein [Natronorubrum thiooxidans]SIR82297.1 hypothetical protein SAMN05421752_103152 [Natronorubrum thiooxidans]
MSKHRPRALRRDLESLVDDLLPAAEATVFAWVVVEYPGMHPNMLPETIRNDVELDDTQIEHALDSLVDRGLFESLGDVPDDGRWFVEPVKDDSFVDRTHTWIEAHGTTEHVDRFTSLEARLKSALDEMRQNDRVEIVDQTASTNGHGSFEEDLDWENYARASEICVSSFSLETMPDFFEPRLISALENGVDVRILLLHPNLGVELERKRADETIRDGIATIESLQDRCANANGTLSYRLVSDRGHAYFYGLLVRSELPEECTYRVFVRDIDRERGVTAKLVRGEEQTTMYLLLRQYFEAAWENGHEPGPIGFAKRNWLYGLTIVPVFGLYLWLSGAIDDLSFALIQAVAIPIAAELVKDGLFALGNR